MTPEIVLWSQGDNPPKATLYYGQDVRETLRQMPDKSVHVICTSPPYWGLRDYGLPFSIWGGDPTCIHVFDEFNLCSCGAWKGCFGLEPTPDLFVEHLVEISQELWRVLRDDGIFWLNLGDSYMSHSAKKLDAMGGFQGNRIRNKEAYRASLSSVGKRPIPSDVGLKNKDLVGIPWRSALSLQSAGWYLRQDIIWEKSNPMPESIIDRCTKAHEYIFMLTKNSKYYFDTESIQEAAISQKGRNKRSVWDVAVSPYKGAHFACVDSETECLTIGGWRRYHELRIGEKIFSYNMKTNLLEIEPIQNIAVYEYKGDLVSANGRSINMLLTPNHRCVVTTKNKKGGRHAPKIVRADELKAGMKFPVAASMSNEDLLAPQEPIEFYELLGWIMSDGYYKDGGGVSVYQSRTAKPDNCERILYLGNLLGSISYRDRERENKPKPDILMEMSLHGKLRQKIRFNVPDKYRVPEHFLLLPDEYIESFLKGFVGGDGHTRRDGRRSIIQKNRQPLDMIQAMLIRTNKACIITPRARKLWTAYVSDSSERCLRGCRHSLIRQDHVYHGNVWCPVVSNGTWVARRGGKPFITGNTWPPKLVEPMILAGTSEKGCCGVCGAPYRRVSEGWELPCSCKADTLKRCVVLDPFSGSGTTGAVALQNNRDYIGIDMNPDYLDLAKNRIIRENNFSKGSEEKDDSILDLF